MNPRPIYLILFLLLTTVVFSSAQGTVTFRKTFGNTRHDFGHSVQQTTDGGYILFGLTTNDSPFNYDLYLIKTDYLGAMQWEKKYGDQSFQVASTVQQTTDGGFILCGADNGYGEDSLTLIKTDAQGNPQWQTKYRMSVHRSVGRYVQQTSDGGFIVTGYSGDSFVEDVYIIKTNANGVLEWSKSYGGDGRDYGLCVRQTNDGGYIVLGETNSLGFGSVDMYVLRINSIGDTLWTRTYGTAGYEAGYSLDLTSDGGFIGLGQNGNGGGDLYLVKADADGNEIWSKSYGGESQDAGYCVQQTTDGGYFLVGTKYKDMYAVKTDSEGEILWEEEYPEGQFSDGYSAQQTSDGGYIMLGSATYWIDSVFTSDMYLVKIDSNGNTMAHVNPSVTLSICPNPVFDRTSIKFSEPILRPYTLLLFDAQGKEVREESGVLFQEIEFERKDLPAGLYFFKILSDNKVLGKGKILVL